VDDFYRVGGSFTGGEAIALMRKTFDRGVTLVDAAGTDAYNTSRV